MAPRVASSRQRSTLQPASRRGSRSTLHAKACPGAISLTERLRPRSERTRQQAMQLRATTIILSVLLSLTCGPTIQLQMYEGELPPTVYVNLAGAFSLSQTV